MQVLLVGWEGSIVQAYPNGTVGDKHPSTETPDFYWRPEQNNDGSWSLQDIHGRYLSCACGKSKWNDTLACTQPHNLDREHIWLESETE